MIRDAWVPRVTVTRVVDGDTFRGDLDLGWGVTLPDQERGGMGSFRVYGINAPERHGATRAAGDAAAEYLASLLVWETSYPILSYAVRWEDDFGRTLADVELPDGRLVSTAMIEAGHAVAAVYS